MNEDELIKDFTELQIECSKLKEKLEIAVNAFTKIEIYRYDVDDIDQEDWFKIATYMAEIANKAIAKIKDNSNVEED